MSTLHSNIAAIEEGDKFLLVDQLNTGRTDVRAIIGKHGSNEGAEMLMTRSQLAEIHDSIGRFLRDTSRPVIMY